MNLNWKQFLPLVVFAFVVIIFFYPIFLNGKLPVPTDSLVGLYHPWRDMYAKDYPRGIPFKNFLITDPIRQQIVWKKIVIDQWKSGHVPSWNPYSFSGTPLAANIQSGAFYPLNILFLALPFPFAWTIIIIFEPLLTGIFFYLYVRRKGLEPLACLFGAIVWSFSGFNIAWLTWGTITHVSLWLPLILLSIDKIVESRTIRNKSSLTWLILFIVALSVQFFAGHSQISLYVIALSLIYAVWNIARAKSKSRVNQNQLVVKKQIALLIGLGVVLFITITAIQWWPLFTLVSVGSRIGDIDIWMKSGWFLPWKHLIQFLVPDFFGNPTTLNYWGEWNYAEFIGYIGILPLMYALYAVVKTRDRTIFWIFILLGCFVMILPSPLAYLPYQMNIPIVQALQPTRLLVIVDFALSVLATYGLHNFMKSYDKDTIYIVGSLTLILLLSWFYVLIGYRFLSPGITNSNVLVAQRNLVFPTLILIIGTILYTVTQVFKNKMIRLTSVGCIVVVVVLDLLRFGWKFTPFTSIDFFFPRTKALAFLQQQQQPFRIMSLDDRILPPNTSSYYDLESIEGYDPLYLKRYEEFIAAIARNKPNINQPFGFNRIITIHNVDSPLLPLLNVRYILTLSDINRQGFVKVFQERETRVYEYKDSLPRVYFAKRVMKATDKQQVLEKLFSTSFNPKEDAVIESTQPDIKEAEIAHDTVNLEFYNEASLIIRTESTRQRFLVVGNTYYPGWTATIDGIKTPIYRTNYIFQGVVVPAGIHTIEVAYRLI